MRNIKRIFVHCTASPQTWGVAELLAEFRRQKWQYPGYHYAITADGQIHQMLTESLASNGVKNYNATAINIAYVGGIDANGKAIDNRTSQQKAALRLLLTQLRTRYPSALILGHRDISPDKNGNGKVDPWERIKECPCFNAITEYQDI